MIYTFIGEESLIDKEIETILEKEINVSIIKYDLFEVSIEKVLEEINSVSLFEEKKVIICSNVKNISNTDDLISYMNNKNDNILILKSDENLNKKLTKELQKHGTYIEISANDLFSYIKESFNDYTISNMNVSLLKEYCNNDFNRLKNEIEKLKMYKLDDKEITAEDIKKIVKKGFDKNVFDLLNAINLSDKRKVYNIYYELLENNEDEIKIISILANNFKLMYKVKALIKDNSDDKCLEILKIHPYRFKKLKEQSFGYSIEKLLQIIVDLSNLDIAIKSGNIDKKIGLELFLAKI